MVTIRHVSDGTTQFQLNNHRSHIRGIDFSPDGRTLAVIDDRVLKLWHVATGQETHGVFPTRDRPIQVSFTPDGEHLIWLIHKDATRTHEIAVFDAVRNREAN